jgi:hypothetical protein
VERATITPEGHVDARLRCEPRTSCIPFYATANVAQSGNPSRLHTWVAPEKGPAVVNKMMVKAGARVVFVSDSAGARILLQVVMLEAAMPGKLVRVRTVDGKHEILRGRLCDGGIVRSET